MLRYLAGALLVPLTVGVAAAQQWSETQKLLAADGGEGDLFGVSVSVAGETAVVGAFGHEKAYVFDRNGGEWSQQAMLTPLDGQEEEFFGFRVAVADGTIIIGAWAWADRSHQWDWLDVGAAYIFKRIDGKWIQVSKRTGTNDGDKYGYSVAASDDTLVVGAPGAGRAYIYSNLKRECTKLSPPGARVPRGTLGFGLSVAVDGETVLVGGVLGTVYVYERRDGHWEEVATLSPSGGHQSDHFGSAVSVSGTVAVVGAYGDNGVGAAYVFERADDATWIEAAKLTPHDGKDDDEFGRSVAVDGEVVIVGAHDADNPVYSTGAAYIFEKASTEWTQVSKLIDPYGEMWENFGGAVSLSGGTALVGASADRDLGPRSGSVFVFSRSDHCPADFNLDGVVEADDVHDFLGLWLADDPAADFTRDGLLDSRDVIAFLDAWASGC